VKSYLWSQNQIMVRVSRVRVSRVGFRARVRLGLNILVNLAFTSVLIWF